MPSTITSNPPQANGLSLDVLTIIAIGVVSYIFKNVLHEAVGHGGACLLAGGVPLALSTAHFDCGLQSVSGWGVRLVAAAGTVVNFIAVYFFWLAFRSPRVKSPNWRYFFWLAMSGNFFVAAGYPLVFRVDRYWRLGGCSSRISTGLGLEAALDAFWAHLVRGRGVDIFA